MPRRLLYTSRPAWVLCLSFILCASLGAQTTTGSVRGTITDSSGAIIPQAKVTVTDTATGVQTVATTNQAGEYSIRFLQIGQYTLRVEASGFEIANYGPFPLEIDQTAKVDIPLTVGSASTTIRVNEEYQPILQTENATNGETFTENTINSVPLNGRDFSQLTVFTSRCGLNRLRNLRYGQRKLLEFLGAIDQCQQ